MRWIVKVTADWALWTPPSFRAERYSQIVGSHDAWVGVLRGILGHKAMLWTVHAVHVIAEPRYLGLTQNELKFNGSGPYDRETQHTQRRTTFLRDVHYVIEASIGLSPSAGPDDSVAKFNSMFGERARKGKSRRQTYLGTRECMALVELHEGPIPQAIDLTQDLGVCFYGTDFYDPQHREPQYFAPLAIEQGVVYYPTWDEVRALGIMRLGGKQRVA